ncbi:MAG: hypothetical protein ACI4RK_08250, partial [Oscillospiraceae bacterium]
RNMVDYQNRKVSFDTPEVRQAVEDLKIIYSRVYQTDLNGTTAYKDSVKGFAEGRYLFCWGIDDGNAQSLTVVSLDGKYYEFAIKWLMIPEASKSKEAAYELIRQIQTIDTAEYYGSHIPELQASGEENWKWQQENSEVIIPNTWVLQLGDLFDGYFGGNISLDNFCEKMQSRLEIYVTE